MNSNTLSEIEDAIESAERHIVKTKDPKEKEVWKDRLGYYFNLQSHNNEYKELKKKNKK